MGDGYVNANLVQIETQGMTTLLTRKTNARRNHLKNIRVVKAIPVIKKVTEDITVGKLAAQRHVYDISLFRTLTRP